MAKRARKPVVWRSPSGISKDAMVIIIDAAEEKRRGWTDYPWTKAVKTKMLAAVQACQTRSDVDKIIEGMRPV